MTTCLENSMDRAAWQTIQSRGSHSVGHDLSNLALTHAPRPLGAPLFLISHETGFFGDKLRIHLCQLQGVQWQHYVDNVQFKKQRKASDIFSA